MRSVAVLSLLCFSLCGCLSGSGTIEGPDGETSTNNGGLNNGGANNGGVNNGATNNGGQNNGTSNNGIDRDMGMSSPDLPDACREQTGQDIYERRIEPLVTGGQPSSCNQCHLSGVNLGMFVQETPCESMACLVELDLVDLQSPQESPILAQIMMAQPDNELITEDVIQTEYDGFLAWIEYSAQCQEPVCGDVNDPCNSGGQGDTSGVKTPLGKCSEEEVGSAFETMVYASRERCRGCHDPDGPRFEDGTVWLDMQYQETDQQSVYEAGLRTMYNLVGLGMINVQTPDQSVLLLKPLAESEGGVPHTGGDKFPDTEDSAYRSFLDWIELYASCYETGNLGMIPEAPYVSALNGERTVAVGEQFNLNGQAIDPQDGILEPSWSSSIAGDLGTGNNLMDVTLSAGDHTITVTATDSDGNTASDETRVIVQ